MKLASALAIIALCSTASASVAEKKSMRSAEEKATAALDTAKKACGNKELAAQIDWDQFSKLDYAKNNVKKEDALRWTGDRAQTVAEALANICNDADYKAEAQKLSKVKMAPNTDGSRNFSFKKSGETLEVGFSPFVVGAAQDVPADLKKIF